MTFQRDWNMQLDPSIAALSATQWPWLRYWGNGDGWVLCDGNLAQFHHDILMFTNTCVYAREIRLQQTDNAPGRGAVRASNPEDAGFKSPAAHQSSGDFEKVPTFSMFANMTQLCGRGGYIMFVVHGEVPMGNAGLSNLWQQFVICGNQNPLRDHMLPTWIENVRFIIREFPPRAR